MYAITKAALKSEHAFENRECIYHEFRRRRWLGAVVRVDSAPVGK